MDTKDHQSNNQQPAAYDVEGRPLYYHPPQDAQPEESQPITTQRPSHVTVLPESMEGQNFDPLFFQAEDGIRDRSRHSC